MRLGDLDALKYEMSKVFFNDNDDMRRIEELIDNAPTVDALPTPNWYKVYEDVKATFERLQGEQIAWEQGYEYGRNEKRPQGEITEEDIQNAIRAGYENGYSMAQAKYQRPQGEWIRKGNETNFWYKCDKCGCEPYYSHSIRTIKFCPNCGAEMVGGES